MVWKVCANGKVYESHNSPATAQRAAVILTAHERKNGRETIFTVTPEISSPLSLAEMNLPIWALEALGETDLLKETRERYEREDAERVRTAWDPR
jgi:hypothetical protein